MLQYFKYRILLLIEEKPTKTTSYDVPQALVARNYHPHVLTLFTYLFSIKFLYHFIYFSLF